MKGNTKQHLENVRTILTNIRDYAPITTKELQQITHYSNSNVALILNKLLTSKHIVCAKKIETSVGRKPQKYDINPNDNLVIGADLGMSGLKIVVTDLCGRVKEEHFSHLSVGMTKDYVLQVLYTNLDSIIASLEAKNVLYIGIAVQGAVEPQLGISKHIAAFTQWDDVPLAALLENRYRIPAVLAHDPDALMRTEKTIGVLKKQPTSSALLIRLEMHSCGMSILANSETYTGVHGYAGEIGRYPLSCSNQGEVTYLDQVLPEIRFLERYHAAGGNTDITSFDQFMDMVVAGDITAKKHLADTMHLLGIALLGLLNMFNPDYLILYGDLCKYKKYFADELSDYLRKNAYDSDFRLAFSIQKSNSAAVGAALLASDKVMETLLLEE